MPSHNERVIGRLIVLVLMNFIFGWSSQAAAQDFTLGSTPLAPSPVNQGSSAVATITVSSLNGFNQAVALSVECPAGTTCTFNPASVTPPAGNVITSTLTIATTASTPTSNTLTVTGSSGGISRTTALILNAQAAPVAVPMAAGSRVPLRTLQADPRTVNRQNAAISYRHLNEYPDNEREAARAALRSIMRAQDTFEPFAANLDTAAELTDTGTGNVPSATGSLQPQAKGVITWESAHFGSDDTNGANDRWYDFSFGGQFGYVPIYTLVNLTNSAGTALTPKARPMFQQGFVWSIRPQLNVHLPPVVNNLLSEEVAVFGGVGQSILTSPVNSFKQSNDTITATIVSNNVGNGALFYETGLQYRLYNTDLATVHRDKSFLNPSFFLESGFKIDSRFKAEGDLAGYDSPRNRAFVRFLVSLNKVTNARGTSEPKEPFSVDFGIAHEIPVSESRVPASTRIIIRGSMDVMKLLKGSQ